MTEDARDSETWKGMRRGVGWAFGVGAVVTAASVLRDGGRATTKSAMLAGLRGRDMAAELSEKAQDLYAEAAHEHHGTRDGQQPPPATSPE